MTEKIAMILALFCAVLFAIEFHEIAHGLVAKWCGDSTAKFAGRLSLNPAKHFDLMGFAMFVLVGFGWAKPVPINPDNFKNRRRDTFFVAIAGIVTNVILAFMSFGFLMLVAFIFGKATVITPVMLWVQTFLIDLFVLGVSLNISLAMFNILPFYPLDGFRVLETFFPRSKVVAFLKRYGYWILLGLLLFGTIFRRVSIYLDPIGLYLTTMQNWMRKLMVSAFGLIA